MIESVTPLVWRWRMISEEIGPRAVANGAEDESPLRRARLVVHLGNLLRQRRRLWMPVLAIIGCLNFGQLRFQSLDLTGEPPVEADRDCHFDGTKLLLRVSERPVAHAATVDPSSGTLRIENVDVNSPSVWRP